MAMGEARLGRLPPRMMNMMPFESQLALALLDHDPDRRPSAWQLRSMLESAWSCGGNTLGEC